MRMPRSSVLLIACLLFCGSAVVAGEGGLKSGPQVGKGLPDPFNPVNVTNAGLPDRAGTRNDYTEQYGRDPVVLIFARELSDPLTTLTRKLDAEVVKNKSARLRAVLVVLSEDEGLEQKLQALGRKEGLKNVSLAFMEPRGPKHYKLAEAADVTVILYEKSRVAANHAFKKGELNDKAIEAVLRAVPGIVSRRR